MGGGRLHKGSRREGPLGRSQAAAASDDGPTGRTSVESPRLTSSRLLAGVETASHEAASAMCDSLA
jgi:hypothetical protein